MMTADCKDKCHHVYFMCGLKWRRKKNSDRDVPYILVILTAPKGLTLISTDM